MEFNHISVLLNECIENLNIKPDGTYIDGTMGGAGHSLKIAEKLNKGKLICIDQDENAIKFGKEKLKNFSNVTFVHTNFSNIENIFYELNLNSVDGVLLDLGVSSHQLDEGERGFSYKFDAKLDMRMDKRSHFTAFNVVNEYSESQLAKIIFEYGEERWAKRIANFICEERKKATIDTTFQLVEIIKKAIPKSLRQAKHPAKKTFQAIRIEVNNELNILKNSVEFMAKNLNKGGRLCIITFHSLEDRIIKNVFKELQNPCTCPIEFPVCVCNKKSVGKVVFNKPIIPSEEEIQSNNRSRSAKLRVFEKN